MAQFTQRCTVCGTENDCLRLTCAACGATLRDRVAGLNLFETSLDLLLEPPQTFLRIARSEQRNYTLLLYSLAGFLFYTILLAGTGANDRGIHLGVLILSYVIGAPVLGMALSFLAGLIAYTAAPIQVEIRRARTHMTLYAWSMMPAALISPVLTALSFAVFGKYLFSLQYTAAMYKPAVFWVLAGLEAASVLLSVRYTMVAFRTLGLPAGKAVLQAGVFWGFIAGCIAGAIVVLNGILNLFTIPM